MDEYIKKAELISMIQALPVLCCAALSQSVVSNSWLPHGLEPTRYLCPWGFSRQEYWSHLPCPPPGDLPKPGLNPDIPNCRWILYCLSHQGSPKLSI